MPLSYLYIIIDHAKTVIVRSRSTLTPYNLFSLIIMYNRKIPMLKKYTNKKKLNFFILRFYICTLSQCLIFQYFVLHKALGWVAAVWRSRLKMLDPDPSVGTKKILDPGGSVFQEIEKN